MAWDVILEVDAPTTNITFGPLSVMQLRPTMLRKLCESDPETRLTMVCASFAFPAFPLPPARLSLAGRRGGREGGEVTELRSNHSCLATSGQHALDAANIVRAPETNHRLCPLHFPKGGLNDVPSEKQDVKSNFSSYQWVIMVYLCPL